MKTGMLWLSRIDDHVTYLTSKEPNGTVSFSHFYHFQLGFTEENQLSPGTTRSRALSACIANADSYRPFSSTFPTMRKRTTCRMKWSLSITTVVSESLRLRVNVRKSLSISLQHTYLYVLSDCSERYTRPVPRDHLLSRRPPLAREYERGVGRTLGGWSQI